LQLQGNNFRGFDVYEDLDPKFLFGFFFWIIWWRWWWCWWM